MNSTPRDSVDLPDAESPASASSTGRSPASRAATLGAIEGTEPSDMRRERTAVVLGGDTATLAQNPSGGTLIGTRTTGERVGDDTQRWNDVAAQIAVDSIRATTAAGSGHPTSSMSCAQLLAVLF